MFRYESVNSTRKFTIVAEIVSLLKKIYKRDAPFRAVFKVKTLAVLFSAYPREMKHIPRNLNLPPFWRCLFLWKWCNPFPRARARLKHAHSFDRCGGSTRILRLTVSMAPDSDRIFGIMESTPRHPRKRFQNFRQSCVLSTDRIGIHQSQPLVWPSDFLYVMLAGCDWWISIRFVDNTQDWRKFWKRFCGCFVFQSRVSTKTVVIPQSFYNLYYYLHLFLQLALHSHVQLRIGSCLTCVYRVMDALGKFGEHEKSVRVSRGSRRWLLECSPNFPSASITRYTHR